MLDKILHQLMVIVTTYEARLKPPELISGVHLGDGQGDRSRMVDAMESDLPSVHRDVLEVTHH